MSEAILPLLGYIIIQFFVIIVGLIISYQTVIGFSGLLKAWVFGQLMLFATLQVLAVPMIILRLNFNVLFWSYLSVCLALVTLGCVRLKKTKVSVCFKKESISWITTTLIIIAALFILYQSGIYFFGMHLDEDDARWLAEANDALEHGHMMRGNNSTGIMLGGFTSAKDVTSPWPMQYAILSRILWNTRVPIVAHTLYASTEILLMYGIYWLIGRELFQRLEARLMFLIASSVLILFYGGTVYTQGAFSLIRIWQGKATVAAVIMPAITYLMIAINKRNEKSDWIKMVVVCCSACLMSGMGTSMAAIMIGVFGFYNIIAYHHWKRIPILLTSILPSIIFSLIYFYIKG